MNKLNSITPNPVVTQRNVTSQKAVKRIPLDSSTKVETHAQNKMVKAITFTALALAGIGAVIKLFKKNKEKNIQTPRIEKQAPIVLKPLNVELKKSEEPILELNKPEVTEIEPKQKKEEEVNVQIQDADEFINIDLSTKSNKELDEIKSKINTLLDKFEEKGIILRNIWMKEEYNIPLSPLELQHKALFNKSLKINDEKTLRKEQFLTNNVAQPDDKSVQAERAVNYLDSTEQRVLGEYYDCYPHNSALREGVDPASIKSVVILDNAFTKAPELKEEAVVYRAVHGHPVFEEQNKFIESIKEGCIINDKSYVSTSTSVTHPQFKQFANSAMGENGGVLMRIKLPAGTKGILGGYSEYLLPRNSQIKVNSIKIVDGHKIADCEYILP